ncbi:MAG TPA: mannosyltransferase family protein, partial [Solirubrobacteraceae bacterium]|nr:mannosyltransferase family protein [Solirubrobacteraceae bacterium]
WAAGVGAVLAFGFGPDRGALDPQGLTRGLGRVGDVLAAAVARWDSAWFLTIARFGYRPDLAPYTSPRAAYFPAYPLGIRAISWTGIPLVLAGVLLSGAAFALALYGIHRLAELELPRLRVRSGASSVPALAVLVTAFSPMAFFFGAVYSEALFMALSVGLFWSARHGRWLQAGLFGALAGATRSTGLMLAVPALLLYLYGPREDRAPDRPPRVRAAGAAPAQPWRSRARELLLPRYRLRADVLWLALLPAGMALYVGWMAAAGGDPLAPFHAEQAWSRHLVGPFVGVWDGLVAGFDGARQLLSFQRAHVYFPGAAGDPFIVASHNLLALAFLLAAIPAFVGVFRRLPLAYGAYALAGILLPLSYPVAPQPLMSIPRYLIVLFPLGIWLAAWLAERPRLRRPLLVACAVAMMVFAGQFSTWHWVA